MQSKERSAGITETEIYGLNWHGKREAIAAAQTSTQSYFKELDAASIGGPATSTNLFIESDNLEALKVLQKTHKSSVHAIYIDPPYNTGNDFVYQDNFRAGKQEYLLQTGRLGVAAENEIDGRFHSQWLSMMYPRLCLARNLLRDDGALFVSIDDHEIDKLRLLLAEIFGEKNFLAQITIQSNPRGRQAEKHFATVHEYLLVFAKDAKQCSLAGAQLTEDQLDEFDRREENGRRYRLLGLRQRGSACLQEDRPNMHYPLYVDPQSGKVSLEQTAVYSAEVLPRRSNGQAGRWMWGRQRVQSSLALLEGKLIVRRNQFDIFVRDYADDADGRVRTRKAKTIWDDKTLNYQNGKRELKALFGQDLLDYPKPLALLRRIIALIVAPDAVFLDFFAGSGTTAQAVLEANLDDGGQRRFILVQIAEPSENAEFPSIAAICAERIRRSLQRCQQSVKEKNYSQSVESPGFRYLQLSTPT